MEKTNKFNEFSILRAIGAIAVLTIHSTSVFGTFNNQSFSYLFFGTINKFCNFAVPIFLFLSVLLLIRNSIAKEKLNIINFYKKRFLKTIPAYLACIAIYYLYLKHINTTLISPINNPLDFCIKYILQGGIYYHLYFMPIILQLYLIFPLIFLLVKKIQKLKINLPIFINFIISFALLVLLQFAFQIFHKYYIWPYYQHPAILLFTYLIPVGMGIFVGVNYDKMKNSTSIKILTLIISGITGYFFIHYSLFTGLTLHGLVLPTYTASISIVMLYIAILIFEKTNILKQTFIKISSHSLTIYLIHPLIQNIFEKHFSRVKFTNMVFIDNFLFILIKFCVVFTVSYLISVLVSFVTKQLLKITAKSQT